MNLPPNFTRQPEFLAFKNAINHQGALEFLFNLCSRCQVERQTEFHLPVEYIAPTLGFVAGEIDPAIVRDALVRFGFIEPVAGKEDVYAIQLFTAHNSQLRACWKNGGKGGRPKGEADATFNRLSPSPRRPSGTDYTGTENSPSPSAQSVDEAVPF